MKIQNCEPAKAALLLVLLTASVAPLRAQTNYGQNNYWVNPGSGKWEVGANWSAGTPPGTNDYDYIFTGTTVTIDATTAGSFPNTMTVTYVAVESPVILELDNAGTNVPLHILQNLDITVQNPYVEVINSALRVDGVMTAGNLPGDTGSFELDSGWAQFGSITSGNSGNGLLYLDGGTLTVLGTLTFAKSTGGGGYCGMYDGVLIHTNTPIVLGDQGYGVFNMYGGSVQALGFQIGHAAGSQGILSVVGGTVSVSSNMLVGNDIVTNPCGVFVMTNGRLTVTNATGSAYIDVGHNGSLTLNGGVLQLDNLVLTNGGTFTNLSGTFELVPAFKVDNGGSAVFAGGSNNFDSGIILGSTNGGSGSLTLQSNGQAIVGSDITVVSPGTNTPSMVTVGPGCSLQATNGKIAVGPSGGGTLTNSGVVSAQEIALGGPHAFGKFFNGGFVRVKKVTCNWWQNNGDMDGSGGTMILGDASHDSLFEMDAGNSTNWGTAYVGYGAGLTGTYTQYGGVTAVTTNMIIGDCVSNALGVATVSGGFLYVTNATGTAVLDVRNGTFELDAGGTVVVDNLVITNPCGHFVNRSGTLIQNHPAMLDPAMSAAGDGIANGWKQQYGFDPFDPKVAAADPDHDGAKNLAEYLAGTNPTNSASVFRMVRAVRTGVDVRVDWTSVVGHSYVVQTNGDLKAGAFNDLFTTPIPAVGPGEGTNSYVHTGGAVNRSIYYRARLAP